MGADSTAIAHARKRLSCYMDIAEGYKVIVQLSVMKNLASSPKGHVGIQ